MLQAERRDLLAKLNIATQTNAELKSELAAYGAADPVKYERKKRAIDVCKESALRWTGKLALSPQRTNLREQELTGTDNTTVAVDYGRALFGMDADAVKGVTGIGKLPRPNSPLSKKDRLT